MSYRAWGLFTDYDYWREQQAWQATEDALERDEADHDRREKERYAEAPLSVPLLLPRRGAG